ncbi:tRNA (N6-threonylcarbamoyladenosine(37)-N6)-methyltransferase TrmO [Desulfothermobacter acidiphilus]|uniref:tRNA (N6-threonylcarbamoyladenosine(37)-N6)-methyltransferase TrmO n=1 Tax=Desulfothermobacter acidiphilus TaxID=1938353 RepID=UPI003F8A2A40
MELTPVGIIHSPYRLQGEAPRQGRFADSVAELEIFPPFAAALKGIERHRYLIVLYWCDKAQRDRLQTRTPHGPEIFGVFACRSPSRPNPLAFCVVRLLEVRDNRLLVQGLDALDGSPLIDIKPYVPEIDSVTC